MSIDRATHVYGRGDYGTDHAEELALHIEERNCAKGCRHSDPEDRIKFGGPGGNCHLLVNLFVELPVPEFDLRPDGIHCDAYESDEPTAPLWDDTRGDIAP